MILPRMRAGVEAALAWAAPVLALTPWERNPYPLSTVKLGGFMADAALERQVSGRQASGRQVSGAYRGLRGWLDMVERLGELKRVSGAHWDVEMGAVTHMLTEKSGGMAPAILFDDVPGYRKGYRTLYGQLSSVKRIALTLGLPLEHERKVDIVQCYHARTQDLKPLPPRYVNDGPIFENVIE